MNPASRPARRRLRYAASPPSAGNALPDGPDHVFGPAGDRRGGAANAVGPGTKLGGMGMGDVKLAGLIGLTTGLSSVLVALFIAILAGGVAGAIIIINGRRRHHSWRGQTMAYAPYLVIGVWVVLFDGIELLHNYLERL